MRLRKIGRLALATSAMAAALAPSAGAMSLPAPDPGEHRLWITPPGGVEAALRAAGGCTAPPASLCIHPALPDHIELLPAATPGTAAIRSLRPLGALTVTLPDGHPPLPVARVDDTHWTVELPPLRRVTQVTFTTAVTDGSGGTWTYLGHLAPPRAEAIVTSAGRRGRALSATVRVTVPGELKVYVTVRGRRLSQVVTKAVAGAGDHAVRVPLSLATLRALPRGAGVTVVFRPAGEQRVVRATHAWRASVAR